MFYIILLIFILIGGALTGLSLLNTNEVAFSLFGASLMLPLGLLLLCAFFLGVVSLYIIAVASAWQEHREMRRLKKLVKEMQQQQQQVTARIPSSPLPGATPFIPMPGMSGPLPSVPPRQQPE